jgi:DNA-directed RNA polymerase specialized sigma24 family protein
VEARISQKVVRPVDGECLETQEIACRLHVSVKTVESYYERIRCRLRLATFRGLFRRATLWRNNVPTDGETARC